MKIQSKKYEIVIYKHIAHVLEAHISLLIYNSYDPEKQDKGGGFTASHESSLK